MFSKSQSKPHPAAAFSGNIGTFWAAVVIVICGLLVFYLGLFNAFLGDDTEQIVVNTPVHSLSNVGSFFRESTFYNGPGSNLTGFYFRPLMVTSYAVVYTVFGPSPVAFHTFQLFLQIICAFLIFLVFRYFFRPGLSLILALVFLVHPINSQAVYSIAALQEPLFFGFGMSAFYLLIKYQDKPGRHLFAVAILLFMSLLSKESGIMFVAMALAYAYAFDRKHFLRLLRERGGDVGRKRGFSNSAFLI